jgi:hypothetical protein
MTVEITARNVNDALAGALHYLRAAGVREDSRNGPVLVAPEPVLTVYTHPRERVLFSPLRDANPFFHLMEALWMLVGRNDVEWPAYFASRMTEFSDDGKTFWGAYGYRWRRWFGCDQLELVVQELKKNPESRRAVLAMWDPYNHEDACSDLHKVIAGGKDVPCNTHAYFDARGGKLNMTVLCRSNDLWWGCYGANAVHFSVLQEYLAAWVGVPVGLYRQFSNNWHLYTNVVKEKDLFALATDAEASDAYIYEDIRPMPLVESIEAWDQDLKSFMEQPMRDYQYHEEFFNGVAAPMFAAWHLRKTRQGTGLDMAKDIAAPDWRKACVDWIERREAKKKEADIQETMAWRERNGL